MDDEKWQEDADGNWILNSTRRLAQLNPAGPAAGKAWWREGMEATLRQAHDAYKQHHDGGKVVCGKPQAITRASKRVEDRAWRGVDNWPGEGW